MELSLLCDSSVVLIVVNNSTSAKERIFEYCSTAIDKHLARYLETSEPGLIKYTNNDVCMVCCGIRLVRSVFISSLIVLQNFWRKERREFFRQRLWRAHTSNSTIAKPTTYPTSYTNNTPARCNFPRSPTNHHPICYHERTTTISTNLAEFWRVSQTKWRGFLWACYGVMDIHGRAYRW